MSDKPRWKYLSAQAPCEPGDERDGGWTRLELEKMNEQFVAAMERAIKRGLEQPAGVPGRPVRAA